jgi:hypothetical protein
MWMSRYSYFFTSVVYKFFKSSCFWSHLLFPFSSVVGKKDTSVVSAPSLSESAPSKTKTQSEFLEDELDLDLDMEDIGPVVSINPQVCESVPHGKL